MKRGILALLAFAVSGVPAFAESAHWGYGKRDGPAVWGRLDPGYALCSEGREQSPIDLTGAEAGGLPALDLDYEPARLKLIRHAHVVDVIDNGHTIQVSYDDGSEMKIGKQVFSLAQYHFHAPSEHTVGGRRFPMEMHLVHQSESGELAVLGVLIAEGRHNEAYGPVWAHLPMEPGKEIHLEDVVVDVDDLLPDDNRVYRYRGSLTTPPCSEGVRWFVAAQPIELSAQQIGAFTAIIEGNNRPVQPLGDRKITLDRGSD